MTDKYTPTTDEVRELIQALAVNLERVYGVDKVRTLPDEFDRWLEAHDREVAAKAWDKCVKSIRYEAGGWWSDDNSHRAAAIERGE